MKYHPLDDVLRPAASAARKAAHGLDTYTSPTTSESTAVHDEDDDTDDSDSQKSSQRAQGFENDVFESPPRRPIRPRAGSPSCRRMTRAETEGERPVMYNMKHHPADTTLRPAAARRAIAKWAKGHAQQPARTARKGKSRIVGSPKDAKADESGSSPASYEAVSDESTEVVSSTDYCTKPVARDNATPTTPSHEGIPDASTPISPSNSSPAEPDAEETAPPTNPLDKVILDKPNQMPPSTGTPATVFPATTNDLLIKLYPHGYLTDEVSELGWKCLSQSDRLLYLLRQGVHNIGDDSIHSWTTVALDSRKHSGLGDFSSISQAISEAEALQVRYNTISQHLHDFFEVERNAATQEDQSMYYAEDFDVYDLEPGDKYFGYKRDSIVQPKLTLSLETTALRHVSNGNNLTRANLMNSNHQPTVDRPENTARSTSLHLKASGSHGMKRQGATSIENEGAQVPRQDNQTYVNTTMDEQGDDARHLPTSSGDTTDEEESRGPYGSYNDEAAYILQATGKWDTCSSTQASPEHEPLESMRNDISADIDQLDFDEPIASFNRAAQPGEWTAKRSDSIFGPFDSRCTRKYRDGSNFSVHEDQPGNTPKIQRQVSMYPKSPGTDVPKENLQERGASEEIQINRLD
ncbi:MAG: hypothetical protein Q9207_007717 [Kuettlingeria erythrocarpa]